MIKKVWINDKVVEVEVTDIEHTPEQPPELTLDEKIAQMAEQLVITQKQLEASQEALDFLLMGGM